MQLIIILAIVSAVSISEAAPPEPIANGGWRLLQALAAMAIAPLFAVAASNAIVQSLRNSADGRDETLRWFGRLQLLHAVIWLLIGAVVLQQVGWVRLVRFNWQCDRTILLDDLLIVLPLLASLVLSWAAFYRVTCAVAGDSRPSMVEYLALQTRHYLGLILVPVFLVLAAHDVVRLTGAAIPPEAAAGVLLLPVLGMILFFPLIIRLIWKTECMAAGPLRCRLEAFASNAGLHSGRFFVWKTGGRIVNAAVAGVVRPWRYVFFSDALLASFNADEVEAVLAHEIAHIRRHHLLWRMLAIFAPIVAGIAVDRVFPQLETSVTVQ